jgi:hypothetical protein
MAITKLSNSGIATGGVLKYDSMLAGNAAFSPSSFESIASTTLGSAAADITFSSIPSTYKHLQIRGFARGSANGISAAGYVQFNGATGSSYAWHLITAGGAGATSIIVDGVASDTAMWLIHSPANTNVSNYFAPFVIDIYDYADTNKSTTARSLSGFLSNNGSETSVRLFTGLYTPTTAVSSIKFFYSGQNIMANSQISLYGIKG